MGHQNFSLKLDQETLRDSELGALQRLHLERPESGISRLTINFNLVRAQFRTAEKWLPGAAIELLFGSGTAARSYFKGEILVQRVRQEYDRTWRLELRAADKMHRLDRGHKQRVFLSVTDADLVQKMASEVGLKATPTDAGILHASIVQPGVSNFALLRERAAHLGYSTWVFDETLHFSPEHEVQAGDAEFEPADRLMKCRVVHSVSPARAAIVARGWDMAERRLLESFAESGSETLTNSIAKPISQHVKSLFRERPVIFNDVPCRSIKELDRLAQSQLQRLSMEAITAEGTCFNSWEIVPGTRLKLNNLPASCQGDYITRDVSYIYADAQLATEFSAQRNILANEAA